jgi:serine/threonine-protein kinase RsbW
MSFLNYPHRDFFAVVLALHEAVGNAFRHGNGGDLRKGIRVSFLVNAAEVLVRVEDQGPGFDLARVPDPRDEQRLNVPGGRGLLLMRAYCDWVSFTPPGNRVTFCRRHSDPRDTRSVARSEGVKP